SAVAWAIITLNLVRKMRLRLNSLKTRTAVAIASVIVAILVANAVYLILTKRGELRSQTEDQARKFALLARDRIGNGYSTYGVNDFKFRRLIGEIVSLNRDVDRIQIIDVDGRVLFDSTQMTEAGSHGADDPPPRVVQDPHRLAAVKAVTDSTIRGRDGSGQETLEIVAPYREDWGRHTLSVAYRVNYRNMENSLARLVYVT